MYMSEKVKNNYMHVSSYVISVCMCACMLVYVCICMYACIGVCMYAYICVCVCMCVQMLVHQHIYIYAGHILCIYVEKISMHVFIVNIHL